MYSPGDIGVRDLKVSDASFMLQWENDPENWKVSNRTEPLTMGDIEALVKAQLENIIYELDQFRFIIEESKTDKILGAIDLYEIDWDNDAAYLGILIAEKSDRRRGAAILGLESLFKLMKEVFGLYTVMVRVQPDNSASLALFEKAGFKKKLEENYSGEQDAEYIEFVCELDKR